MSIEERLTFIEDALASLSEDTRELLKEGSKLSSDTGIQARLKAMRKAFAEREGIAKREQIKNAIDLISSVNSERPQQ